MTLETSNLLCAILAFSGQMITYSYRQNIVLVGSTIHTLSLLLALYQFNKYIESSLLLDPLSFYIGSRFAGYMFYRFVIPLAPAKWMLLGVWCTNKFPAMASKSMFTLVKHDVGDKTFSQYLPHFILNNKFIETRHMKYKHDMTKGDDAFSSQAFSYLNLGHRNKEIEFVDINSKLVEYPEKNLFKESIFHEVISNRVYNSHFEPPEKGEYNNKEFPILSKFDTQQFDVDAAYQLPISNQNYETYFFKVLDAHHLVTVKVLTHGTLDTLSQPMLEMLTWYFSAMKIDEAAPRVDKLPTCADQYRYLPPSIKLESSCPSEDEFRDFLRLHADDPISWYVFEASDLYRGWFRSQYSWLRVYYKKARNEHNIHQLKTYRV